MFLRRLNLELAADEAIATSLFVATPSYELATFGRLPSAATAEPLSQRFPVQCRDEDRLTIAALDHDEPIGLAQIALHAPTSDCAALLLLLVPTHLQQRHFGCEIVDRLSRQARRWPGISSWYVTVLESNTAALAFWRHCGFKTKSQSLKCPGFGDRVSLLTRAIKAKPACQHHGRVEDTNAVVSRQLLARLG